MLCHLSTGCVWVCSAQLLTGAAWATVPVLGTHKALSSDHSSFTLVPQECPLCFSGPTPSERAPTASNWAPGDTILSLYPRARGAGLEGAMGEKGSNKAMCPSNLSQQPLRLSHSARLLQSPECLGAVKTLLCAEHVAGQRFTAIHVM